MAKVLDGERPRTTSHNTAQTTKRRGRPVKLSLERLSKLIIEEGPITDSAIALKLHVSRQTVMRARKRAEAVGRYLESVTQERSASRRKATNAAPFLALLGQMEWLIAFLRECLKLARSVETPDQPPIPEKQEES